MSMRISIVMLSEVRFENVHENMLYVKLTVVTKKRLGWGTYYFPTNLPSQNTEPPLLPQPIRCLFWAFCLCRNFALCRAVCSKFCPIFQNGSKNGFLVRS